MGEATADAGRIEQAGDAARADDRNAMVRELRDSALLIGLALSTMGVYLGLGAAVVRLFANR
jgi:hypothetical protein